MPTKLVSVRMDEELLKYLQNRADKEHRSLSNMIHYILMNDKSENGRPTVSIGDTIKCRDGQAIIKDIDNEVWVIEWQNGKTDNVPPMLQHNWTKITS